MRAIPGKYHHTNMDEGIQSSKDGGKDAVKRALESMPNDVRELSVTVTEIPGGDYRVEYRYVKP